LGETNLDMFNMEIVIMHTSIVGDLKLAVPILDTSTMHMSIMS